MSDAIDQIPRLCELVGPGIDAIVAQRPKALKHFARGRWGDLTAGWEAQAALVVRRLSAEAKARSLENASGQPLVELAASDFWAELPTGPTKAVGEVGLLRQVTNASASGSGNFAPGAIPAGKHIHRDASDTGVIPIPSGDWVTTADASVGADDTFAATDLGGGSYLHSQLTLIPIEAMRTGTDCAVLPLIGATTPATIIDTLFDTFTVYNVWAGGGSEKRSDLVVRAFARAMAVGLFGPTAGAALAGALLEGRVSRFATSEDTAAGTGIVYVADEVWGSSAELCRGIQERLDGRAGGGGWRGFGPKASVRIIYNQLVKVAIPVTLSDPRAAQREPAITKAIEKKVRAYLDDRPDWWTWRTNELASAAGAADRDILSVGAPVMTSWPTGAVLTEPSGTLGGSYATHFYLTLGGLSVAYSLPS